MNIFKKIGSFATSSWKDFSEYQQALTETPDVTVTDNVSNTDDKLSKEGSFELRKRDEKDVLAKKAVHGFFRKRFSKKKLQMILADPRSPTTDFARTPIQKLDSTDAGILSPFNVQDMLNSVDSAVSTPKKQVDFNILMESAHDNEAILDDKEFLENVGDWNDFNFNNEKVMTESLIVEISTLDIKGDLNSSTNDDENAMGNTSNEAVQCLLESEKDQEEDESIITEKCKIIGCIIKSDDQIAALPETQDGFPSDSTVLEAQPLVASTPKKATTIKLVKEMKKIPRTPLQAISNSPLVKSNNQSQTKQSLGKKKKVTARSRQLPKAPSTPLTPLFKSKQKCVSNFDKENF